MVSVELLRLSPVKTEAGYANFYALPLTEEKDFSCNPPNLLTFEEGVEIADALRLDKVTGHVGDYEWRR